jgi:hypothetical protein
MMNRGVLERQMFANGGQAVPNEYKGFSKLPEAVQMKMDPVAAKKYEQGGVASMSLQDYLGDQAAPLAAEAQRLGISVEELLALLNQSKQEQPVGMAMGGDPAMAQGVGSMMQMPTDPSQAAPVDPQIVEGLLTDAASEVQDLENVEDYETMINAIRGDELPMEARREELAELVGPEDAAQTPDSVLALAQPAIVMASVDEGIGGLAQAEMTQEVSGPMAGGIMSTVAPPQPPAGMGGPPPVNFKEGGLVRRGDNQPVKMMKAGGDPLQTAFESRLPIYEGILGDPTAQLEEQKNLTKANMLFDIANTALAFAAPMEGERPGMSAAERLAMAARTTQLPQTIGARAQSQLDAEKAAKAQQQQMRLSALTAAEADVTAQAKAKADLAKTRLEGAQKISQIELEDALDTKRDLTVQSDLYDRKGVLQQQKFVLQNELNTAGDARRLEIETQLKAIDLENDKIMEGIKASNKEALQATIFDFDKQLAILKADKNFENDTALQASAAKISENLAILNSNLRLGEMGVANEYDLEKLELSQGFEREINNTNNALKEKLSGLDRELSERRLKLDTIKAEVARAQGERKLELQAEANAMEADLNAFTMNYKTEKLDLERAAARLTRLGTNTEARITTLISDPESLAKYAAGTMTPEQTLEFNQAIAYYNAPKQVWNEKEKRFVLSPGNPLSNELMSSIKIRQENGLTIPNIKLNKATPDAVAPKPKEEVVSSIMAGIKDPSVAFGTKGQLKSVANTVAEIFFLGAPYKAEKSAIAGAKALNTKFVQVFQRSAELRDSVMQLNLLKDLTPTPASMFTGPEAAGEDVKRLLGMIDEAEQALKIKLDDPNSPLTSKEVSEARGYLTDLAQLRAGYSIFDNAYKNVSKSKVNTLRKTLGLGE